MVGVGVLLTMAGIADGVECIFRLQVRNFAQAVDIAAYRVGGDLKLAGSFIAMVAVGVMMVCGGMAMADGGVAIVT